MAAKVSGIGCCSCSIKHLIMMSDTVVLLLSRILNDVCSLICIHISERKLCTHIDMQSEDRYILWYSYLFNWSTDGCLVLLNRRRERARERISAPSFTFHLSCISNLLRLSSFERTTQFAFSNYTNDPRFLSNEQRMLVGCH